MQLPETIETSNGLSVANASTSMLESLLLEFEEELRKAGVPVADAFADGLSPDEIAAVFERIGLPMLDEVVAWFGWHNGVTSLPLWGKAFPRFQFYPLAVVEERFAGIAGWQGIDAGQWNPNWIQLLGDQNGLAIDCIESIDGSPKVRPLTHSGDWGTQANNGPMQVVSLCTPVTWWIESLRSFEYTWHPDARAWDWDFAKKYDRIEKRAYI